MSIPQIAEIVNACIEYKDLPVLLCWSATVIGGTLVALGLSGLKKR